LSYEAEIRRRARERDERESSSENLGAGYAATLGKIITPTILSTSQLVRNWPRPWLNSIAIIRITLIFGREFPMCAARDPNQFDQQHRRSVDSTRKCRTQITYPLSAALP